MLGPIFADGSFEFIPIDADRDSEGRTYGDTVGRYGRKLIEYFPETKRAMMKNRFLHFDPEFETFTYGDPTRPKQSLRRLKTGDLLVFYAGLRGWGDCETLPGLYIIGYFVIEKVGIISDLQRDGGVHGFDRNWHVLNGDDRDRLVLVKGGRGSRLLHKAVRISARSKARDGGGHPVFVLDEKMQDYFGSFTKLNAIQRSTPRWVKPRFCEKAAAFVLKLK
jgi:hypothetical protein